MNSERRFLDNLSLACGELPTYKFIIGDDVRKTIESRSSLFADPYKAATYVALAVIGTRKPSTVKAPHKPRCVTQVAPHCGHGGVDRTGS